MTVKQARKILGLESELISDEELRRDVDLAEFMKNLFFDQYSVCEAEKPKITGLKPQNVP